MVRTAAAAHADAEERALTATKAIFDGVDSLTVEQLRSHAKVANKAVVAMRRAAAEMLLQANARESVLREALHGELLDYEANAARCFDRARATHVTATQLPIELARGAVAVVDASIAQLCAHARDAPENTRRVSELTDAVG